MVKKMKDTLHAREEISEQEMIARTKKLLTEELYLRSQHRLADKKITWYEISLFVGFTATLMAAGAALLAAGKYLL